MYLVSVIQRALERTRGNIKEGWRQSTYLVGVLHEALEARG